MSIKTPEEIAKEIVKEHFGVPWDYVTSPLQEAIASVLSAERNANLEKIRELQNELERIKNVAIRLRNSDDENEISLNMNIAGDFMLQVLNGENFS